MVRYQKFDWFTLNRDNLFDVLYTARESIVGQKLTIAQIHNRLANTIRNFLPVRVRKEYDPKVQNGWIYIGGAYHSDDDQEGRKCVIINFAYNTQDKFITVSSRRFSRMCIGFADTVLHEIMHMRQHRRRNFKVLPDYASTAESTTKRREQEYLGNTDEIDAYSFNIACALMQKFRNNTRKAVYYLDHNRKLSPRSNWGLTMYLDAFDRNHSHPIIRRLKKKIIRYFPNAQEGKPYKGKDWINR